MNKDIDCLIKAYRDYIKLLGEELSEVVPLSVNHGWSSSRVEEGRKMRCLICELEKKCGYYE